MLFPAHSAAAPVTVEAKLDSAQMLMGRITMLRLQVVQDKNTRGEFEIFRSAPPSGYIAVCGDSVELRTAFERDTVELGSGRCQINYAVPVQAFDSGLYRLPQLRYIAGHDTVLANAVTLKVLPVKGLTADSQISGYADVMDPAEKSFTDYIPDFLYYYWWIFLLVIALIVLLIIFWKRLKKKGSLLPKKIPESPYVVAVREMKRLKEQNLWEKGQEREYFTDLTDILRNYLDARFNINAMEMTSRQIMDSLSSDKRISDKKEYVRKVLDMADFVKFAAMRTLPEDNIASYENVMNFIEETKPTPEEEEARKARLRGDDGFEIHDDDKKPVKRVGKGNNKKKSLKKSAAKGGKKGGSR